MFFKIKNHNIKNRNLKKVEELSGQKVFDCYQCGNCSSSCPVVDYMDYSPNQVLRLSQYGAVEEILESETIWVCSTCLQCSTRCPKGIDIAAIMEVYRSINLRKRDSFLDPALFYSIDTKDIPPILLVSALRKMTG